MAVPVPDPAPISPLRVARDAPALLLLGGSFDPPHAAHVRQARAALRRAMPRGTWLVLVPAARSPHKRRGPRVTDRDRLAMLRAAFAPVRRCAIWTDELDRARAARRAASPGTPATASYWVETLERLRATCPVASVGFLIGSDQAAAFHRWRRPRDIMELARPLVVLRPPVRTRGALRRVMARSGFWTATELDEWAARVVRCPLMDTSSTALRRVLTGTAGAALVDLPPAVGAYIDRRGLYR